MAEQRAGATGYRPKTTLKEAKSCKSYATMELLARSVPFLPWQGTLALLGCLKLLLVWVGGWVGWYGACNSLRCKHATDVHKLTKPLVSALEQRRGGSRGEGVVRELLQVMVVVVVVWHGIA